MHPKQALRPQRDGSTHKAISARFVSKLIGPLMRSAGVAESAHALRHTALSDVLKGGAHLRDVQAMAGHASLRTTQIYMPLLVGDLREAMAGRDYLAANQGSGPGRPRLHPVPEKTSIATRSFLRTTSIATR
ncbi:MAG: tyrosine-type recombinase/integrase [Acidimicrobiales bacterium]